MNEDDRKLRFVCACGWWSHRLDVFLAHAYPCFLRRRARDATRQERARSPRDVS